jgi:hypothetical protein
MKSTQIKGLHMTENTHILKIRTMVIHIKSTKERVTRDRKKESERGRAFGTCTISRA